MEHKITGCTDCPLYDSKGVEYGVFCHHPNKSLIIKDNIFGHIEVREPYIEEDEDYNPITPDWCPLNKEPITITKK